MTTISAQTQHKLSTFHTSHSCGLVIALDRAGTAVPLRGTERNVEVTPSVSNQAEMPKRKLLPFTLVLLMVIGCGGVYFGSHVGATDSHVHQVAGYSIQLVIEGELQRAVTSLFITDGGWRFYSSMVMLAVCVGFVEATRGTLRALLTFFSVHFATLLALACIILCFHALVPTLPSHLLLHTRDVGPSAGYYGCLGLAITSAKPAWRAPIISIILIALSLRAAHSFAFLPEQVQTFEADLAHLIAFPLGIASSRLPHPASRRANSGTLQIG